MDNYKRDDEETIGVQEEEVEKLKQCLPRATYKGNIQLLKYQEFWVFNSGLRNVISFQKHFQARDSDLIIASCPKTGNTWLKALLFAVVDRVNGHPISQSPLLKNHPHELVYCLENDIYGEAFDYPRPHHLNQLPSPRLLHTHLPYHSLPQSIKTSGCRILYLARNHLDMYVSLLHFSKINKEKGDNFGFPSMEVYFEECYKGTTPFGPCLDHLVGFWKPSLEQPDKVLFLLYEDLKDDPVLQLKKLANFVGLPFTPQEESQGVLQDIIELCSFKNLKNLEVNKSGVINKYFEKKSYFRKGEVGDSTHYFSPSMVERMNQLIKEKLDGTGFNFKSISSYS